MSKMAKLLILATVVLVSGLLAPGAKGDLIAPCPTTTADTTVYLSTYLATDFQCAISDDKIVSGFDFTANGHQPNQPDEIAVTVVSDPLSPGLQFAPFELEAAQKDQETYIRYQVDVDPSTLFKIYGVTLSATLETSGPGSTALVEKYLCPDGGFTANSSTACAGSVVTLAVSSAGSTTFSDSASTGFAGLTTLGVLDHIVFHTIPGQGSIKGVANPISNIFYQTPETSTYVLIGSGLVALWGLRRFRKKVG